MYRFSHHIGDWDQDTAHLSFIEDAAYHKLVRRYYATESQLPPDTDKIKRFLRCRTPAERRAVDVVLDEFFVLTDYGYSNKRCDEEIAKYYGLAESNAEKGRRRWQNEKKPESKSSSHEEQTVSSQRHETASSEHQKDEEKQRESLAVALPEHSRDVAAAMPTVNRKPVTVNREPITDKKTPQKKPADAVACDAVGYSADFEKIWKAYPKRSGSNPKLAAWKAWQARLKSGVTPDEMVEGAERYASYCQSQGMVGGPYVKMASTFLGPDLHFQEDWMPIPAVGRNGLPTLPHPDRTEFKTVLKTGDRF